MSNPQAVLSQYQTVLSLRFQNLCLLHLSVSHNSCTETQRQRTFSSTPPPPTLPNAENFVTTLSYVEGPAK